MVDPDDKEDPEHAYNRNTQYNLIGRTDDGKWTHSFNSSSIWYRLESDADGEPE